MISASDIKLLESEIMADSTDGGGRKTSRVILDGVLGNVFPKISRVDSVYGRVNLRKVYGSVVTSNQDTYAGAHAIVTDAPDNEKVHCCLFSTGSEFDDRSEVQSRIESYLNSGAEWDGFLFEAHIKGQKVIQTFTRPGADVLTVGKTVVLRCNEGTNNEYEQYVRITRVTSAERIFNSTDSDHVEYTAIVSTCDISDALRYDFPGSPHNRRFTRLTKATAIKETVVADAAVYHGVAPMSMAASKDSTLVRVESVYSQLVPNTRTESPAVDLSPSSEFTHQLATTPRVVTDSGAPFSQRIRVGTENRGFSYVTILRPPPSPGLVKIVYRAMGANHSLVDDGLGNLSGAGAGTVNYLTGSVSITLQAMPDDRSNIVFYWGQTVSYTNRAGLLTMRPPEVTIPLSHPGIEPGSVVITWVAGGVTRTATTNTSGDISGAAAGVVDFAGGVVYMRPSYFPDPGAPYNVDYQSQEMTSELKPLGVDDTGSASIVLNKVPLPGSIELTWLVSRRSSESSGSSVSSSSTTKSSESHGQLVGEKLIANYVNVKVTDYAELSNAVMAKG